MDTKEMRDRMKQKTTESVAIKQTPDRRVHTRRVRSYKSLIINLIALIGLFALVFLLQQVGTRHAEKTVTAEPTTQITKVITTEITVEESALDATPAKPVKETIQNQEVAMVEFETTEEGAAQPKAQAKIILKTKKTKKITTANKPRKTVKRRTNYGQPWREDRLRSASLVDMLDGPSSKHYTNSAPRTYTTTTPQRQTTYPAPYRSYSGRADRRSSAELVDMLDGGGIQNKQQRRSKRLNWANDVPMAATRTTYSGVEETTLAPQTRGYATAAPQEKPTYVAPSRRPAWDVNAGEGR